MLEGVRHHILAALRKAEQAHVDILSSGREKDPFDHGKRVGVIAGLREAMDIVKQSTEEMP